SPAAGPVPAGGDRPHRVCRGAGGRAALTASRRPIRIQRDRSRPLRHREPADRPGRPSFDEPCTTGPLRDRGDDRLGARMNRIVLLGTGLYAEELTDVVDEIEGMELVAYCENLDRSKAGGE